MAINENGLLVLTDSTSIDRVFLPSSDINVFPCSRRGQGQTVNEDILYYDPEARLNTEHTNRLHTAINGFTDSFISSYESSLIFVLAGYYVEIKNFNPDPIADALGADTLYAHLRLHTGVSLGVADYFTEMLYRQSDSEVDKNYLDVTYTDGSRSGDFFMGISFAKEPVDDTDPAAYNLPLFSLVDSEWELVQTSLLPKIAHDMAEDSIKIGGNFTVEHTTDAGNKQVSFSVTKDKTFLGPTQISELTVGVDKFSVTNADASFTVPVNLTEKLTIADDLIVTNDNEVKTPQLRVNRITSDGSDITIDNNKLIINKSLEMLAKDGNPAKATISQAIIGDLTVEQDNKFPNSSGKITADEIQLKNIGQVPALEIAHFTGTDTYQLRFRFNVAPSINDIPLPPSSDEVLPDTLTLTDGYGNILTDINDLILVINAG